MLYYYSMRDLSGEFLPFGNTTLAAIIAGILGGLIGFIYSLIHQQIHQRFTLKQQLVKSVLLGTLALFILGITLGLSPYFLYANFSIEDYKWQFWWSEAYPVWMKLWVLMLTISFFINLIFTTLFSFRYLAKSEIAHRKTRRKQLELQFELLKSQLSPHFLFNNLNTISSIIHKENTSVEPYIRKFAHTYQYILDTHHKPLVSLEEELSFVKAYFYLIKSRFDQGIDLKIEMDKQSYTVSVPPLAVQLLVENAIKHNVISKETPLQIKIRQEQEILYVKNNVTQKPAFETSFHIGLNNIRKRYAQLSKKKIKVLEEAQSFEVQLPLFSNE